MGGLVCLSGYFPLRRRWSGCGCRESAVVVVAVQRTKRMLKEEEEEEEQGRNGSWRTGPRI